MASYTGSEIVNDGLILHFDTHNTKNSFKGKPTTNLNPQNIGGMSGVSLTYIGIENGWRKYAMSGTFTSATYPYCMLISGVTFTGGQRYTSSLKIKTSAEYKFASFGGYINYVNEPKNRAGDVISELHEDGSYFISRSGFEYTNTTTQTGYLDSRPIQNTTFNPSTDFVYVKEIQTETGNYPTPYVDGTRSTSQALIDVTGNHTLTQSGNVVYNEDNELSFNGQGEFVTPAGSLDLTNKSFTVDVWVRRDNMTGNVTVFGHEDGVGPSAQKSIHFRIYSTGQLRFDFFSDSINWYGANFTPGRYHNLTATYDFDTDTCSMYFNGQLVASGSVGPYIGSSTTSITTFGSWNTRERLLGDLPVGRVYNRALSAYEVERNYNSYEPIFRDQKISREELTFLLDAADPKSYDGTGNTWYDLSDNSNNGTILSGVEYSSINKGFTSDTQGEGIYVDYASSSVWTLSMWFRKNATGSGISRIAGTGPIPDRGEVAMLGDRISINGPDSSWRYSSGYVSDGETVNVVVVFDTINKKAKVYKNTELVLDDTYTTAFESLPTRYTFMQRNDFNNEWLPSTLYQVARHSRELTIEEITENYKAFRKRISE